MKSKYKKSLSIIMILVILVSHSIIPVSASSDYYSNTYNGYDYDCRSQLYQRELYGEINYAGSSKVRFEASFSFINTVSGITYYDICTTMPRISSASHTVILEDPLEFIDSYYTYTIVPSTVYTVGLTY